MSKNITDLGEHRLHREAMKDATWATPAVNAFLRAIQVNSESDADEPKFAKLVHWSVLPLATIAEEMVATGFSRKQVMRYVIAELRHCVHVMGELRKRKGRDQPE